MEALKIFGAILLAGVIIYGGMILVPFLFALLTGEKFWDG